MTGRPMKCLDGALTPCTDADLAQMARDAEDAARVAEPIPPDCLSLPWWRSGLKYWLRDDGSGGKVRRFDDVDAAIKALETAQLADGAADVSIQRMGTLAREQFEYANGAARDELMTIAPAFGFSPADVDESLWRADRVRRGDLTGVWPLPVAAA